MTQPKNRPLGSVWVIDAPKGERVNVERPDGTVAVVSDGSHILDLAGEYVATVGEGQQRAVAK